MTTHRTPMRIMAKLAATLVTVAMMWLPGVAHATTPADDPGFTDTTLPLLGSNLVVEITTDGNGTVTSVTVDGQAVDFAQDDDEITFVYGDQTITIEVGNRDGNDQGDEADDDQGDQGDDNHQGDEADDDQGDDAGNDNSQGDEADDDQGDEADSNHQGDQGDDDQGDDDQGEDS